MFIKPLFQFFMPTTPKITKIKFKTLQELNFMLNTF